MSRDDDQARQAREKARASWTGGLTSLEDMADVELIDAPPAVLVALVTELTLAAWAMRGAPLPTYARADAPGRVLRPGDPG